jgi:hypothetical protein
MPWSFIASPTPASSRTFACMRAPPRNVGVSVMSSSMAEAGNPWCAMASRIDPVSTASSKSRAVMNSSLRSRWAISLSVRVALAHLPPMPMPMPMPMVLHPAMYPSGQGARASPLFIRQPGPLPQHTVAAPLAGPR